MWEGAVFFPLLITEFFLLFFEGLKKFEDQCSRNWVYEWMIKIIGTKKNSSVNIIIDLIL